MIVTKEKGTQLPDTTMESPVYVDARKAPFKLYGFSSPFRRVPENVAQATSEKVALLAVTGAGGRVRFRTNSSFIAVHAEYSFSEGFGYWPSAARQSFDIYFYENGKQKFRGVMLPSQGEGKTYIESRLRFDGDIKDVTIYFPLATAVTELYIGLEEGCEIAECRDYAYESPVVFYGSSIVHGSGAMRASSTYTSLISRRLDTNFINLGFGGGAKAEQPIMEYIAGIDMSIFVYDYDHNAPTYEYLEKTHYEGYRIFRSKQPSTPVIMASRVDIECGDREMNEKCRALIEANYKRALAEGDKNVYFIDGSKIYPENKREECTFDGCHPNDMGYSYMADAFGDIIKNLL